MSRTTIRPEMLGAAIQDALTVWSKDVQDRVDAAAEKAIKKMVKLTKASAPVKSGDFKRSIKSEKEPGPRGNTYVWGAKAPHYRLTHLLVHGHAKRNGGRVGGDPFLENAMAQVLPEDENAVKEAVEK